MEQYIIWGAGYQGSIIYELLKDEVEIPAFVDNSPKLIGSTYKGVKVISFNEYLQHESKTNIIISPRKSGSIVSLLKKNGINNYVIFSDLADLDSVKEGSTSLYEIVKNKLFSLQKELINEYVVKKYLNQNSKDLVIDWKKQVSNIKNPVISISNKSLSSVYDIIFNKKIPVITLENFPKDTDLLILHGLNFHFVTEQLAIKSEIENIPKVFGEIGFLYGVVNNNTVGVDLKYMQSHSAILDDKGLCINANGVSSIEAILSSNFQLTQAQYDRAENLIKFIKEHKISKYNHQPAIKLNIGTPGRKKVLVIDQVYGDQSIRFGWANDQTFTDMLEAAISENPDADILVKTHPEGNVTKGYFTDMKFEQDNVYKISFGINPISLLEQVDKVYVCTSQMGFEALMCNKEVHVFGMPFYCGWNAVETLGKGGGYGALEMFSSYQEKVS